MCGTRLIGSAVLAAAALTIVPSYVPLFNSVDRQTLVFGVAAIVAGAMFGRRNGLGILLRNSLASLRRDDRQPDPADDSAPPPSLREHGTRTERPSLGAIAPIAARSDARP
jgi:hypothetical protein